MKRILEFCFIMLIVVLFCSKANANTVVIGEGNELSEYGPFNTGFGGNIVQMIITGSELKKAKATKGNITSIAFKAQSNENSYELKRFRVRMSYIYDEYFTEERYKEPTHIALGADSPESVYTLNPNDRDWIEITLSTPFYWDGNANVLIEIAWTNNNAGANPPKRVLYAHSEDDENNCKFLFKRQDNVTSLSGFSSPLITPTRPNIKLTFSVASPSLEVSDTQVALGYLDYNSISEVKTVEINANNLNPQNGAITCTPSKGLIISEDKVNWRSYPETLSIEYENGSVENKAIYCKMKSPSSGENFKETLRISAPGANEKIVTFTAQGGSIFKYYCESSAYGSEGGDISNISVFYEDGMIFTNGKAEPIYNRDDCDNKYSDFTKMKPIPLRENTEYRVKISLAHRGKTAKSGSIKIYLDYNRNTAFEIDELIWTEEKTKDGTTLESNNYWSNITMPSKARLSGDSLCLLRIVYDEEYDCNSCGVYNTGETEDYAVKLIDAKQSLKTPLAGEYTIGGKAENEKHYNNLPNLAKDIEEVGLGGDVILAINTNLNIPEGKCIELNNKSKYKITIYPKEKTRTISGSCSDSEGKALLCLKGNIEMSGKIDNATERNALKIRNLAPNGTAISIETEANDSLSIHNLNIESENGIRISGNSKKKIEVSNNKFACKEHSLSIIGDGIENISILDNHFTKGGGVKFSGTKNTKVINNEFDLSQSAERSVYAIELMDFNSNTQISNNAIHNLKDDDCTGAIRINGKDNSGIIITNNAINCNNASSGIAISGRDVKIYHNTVIISGTSKSAATDIAGDAESISMKNNLFINNGSGVSMIVASSSAISECEHNNYYSEIDTKSIGLNGEKLSLEQWKSKSGKDVESTSESVSLLVKMQDKAVLSIESAMNEKLLAPALGEVKNDIQGIQRNAITHKGADEAIPVYEIDKLVEEFKVCAPDTIKLKIEAKLLKFKDDIKRGETKNYAHKYRYYWRKNGAVVDTISNTFHAVIEGENINKPIEYTVEVATHGQSKVSNTCAVFSEETIVIKKEPQEAYTLSKSTPEAIIKFEADGTTSGYQWQKLIKSKWENLAEENGNTLRVSSDKYGVGVYRSLVFDGEYKCNKGSIATKRARVSIDSKVEENDIISYANNRLIIAGKEGGFAEVEIMDILGRRIEKISGEINENQSISIDTSSYENNMYFVIININNTIKVAKFIKK